MTRYHNDTCSVVMTTTNNARTSVPVSWGQSSLGRHHLVTGRNGDGLVTTTAFRQVAGFVAVMSDKRKWDVSFNYLREIESHAHDILSRGMFSQPTTQTPPHVYETLFTLKRVVGFWHLGVVFNSSSASRLKRWDEQHCPCWKVSWGGNLTSWR